MRQLMKKANGLINHQSNQQVQVSEEEALRKFFPQSFGKKKKKKTISIDTIHAKLKKQEPMTKSKDGHSAGNHLRIAAKEEEHEEEEHEEEQFGPARPTHLPVSIDKLPSDNEYKLPISHEVILRGGSGTISALDLDRSGARVLAGSYDYMLRFWDFGGMNRTLQSFRCMEPEDGHQVVYVAFNQRGSLFLCCTGSAQPKLYDRDGININQFVRGDPYLHDKRYTKGHVTSVYGGQWNPQSPEEVITCGQDGTVRIWDINQPVQNIQVLKLRASTGRNAAVTACCYSPNGVLIFGSGSDGSIQMWKRNSPQRAKLVCRNAHIVGTHTSCVAFSKNKHTLLSRGGDDTLKVWDIRKFKKPIKVWSDVENGYAQTNVIFSPENQDLIATGVGNKSKSAKGRISFYDLKKLKHVQNINISNSSVVRVLWHREINQIFAGCSDGNLHLLYNPRLSIKGALLCVGKAMRKKHAGESMQLTGDIINPHSLPMYRKKTRKRQRAEDRRDPAKTKMPEEPQKGTMGTNGRRVSNTLIQYMFANIVSRKIASAGQDPREEILKHAKESKENPLYFKCYQKTQPIPIFQKPKETEDESSFDQMSNKRPDGPQHK